MPQKKQGAPARARTTSQPARGNDRTENPSGSRTTARAGAPGARSPKHRGYRPEEQEAPAKKARWSKDDRADRGHAPDRRGERDDRPARSNDRDDRAPRAGHDDRDARQSRGYDRDARPARSNDRDARPARSNDRDARPTRSYDRDDRAPRSNSRDDRPARSFDRDARPARSFDRNDRGGRPARTTEQRTGTGRTAHRPEWRPQERSTDQGRPARSWDRDARPARSFERDERAPRSTGRDDRPARSFDRDSRPARSFDRDERAPRSTNRDDRPARSFDRDDRAARPARTESSFYPSRDAKSGPTDDVVLERLAADAVQARDVEGVTFGDLGLGGNITRTLEELGAIAPFPIQAATIPDVLAGRDVLGRGRTGSGKTIAFGAPLVERLMENGGGKKRQMGRAPRALIMAPTRELALQIDRTVQPIARSVGLFTTQIYGGVPQGRQVGALQRGVDIIIGTPGRIEDLIEQGRLDLSQIEIVVLDEADHMCELGFLEPVQRIIRRTRQGNQKLLFSATLDSGVANLVDEFLQNPSVYEVAGEDQQSSTIDHKVLMVEQRDKRAIIEQLASGDGKTLVFARTRAFAEELADQLDDAGIPAVSLHGDLNQARRTRNLEKLTSGRVKVLVATDVAARGIHVDDISLVVQADAPDEYKTYLHRAGRTGRAGKVGTVVTLITRPRRRRFDELLGRAEIEAQYLDVRPGDESLDALAAL